MNGWTWCCLVSLVACEVDDDPFVTDAPLATLCGQDEPVEMLRLEEGEAVGTVDPIDDMFAIHTMRVGPDGEPPEQPPTMLRRVLVDGCGTPIDGTPAAAYFLFRWDGFLFGTTDEGLVRLRDVFDPAPELVARSWHAATTTRGVVVHDADPDAAETGPLVLLEREGSGLTRRVLLDDVEVPEFSNRLVIDDRVFARQGDRVWSLAADGGDMREEAHLAGEWTATAEFILFRRPDPVTGEPGELVLRDRATGEDSVVETQSVTGWNRHLYFEGWLVLISPEGQHRWFRTRPLVEVVAPEGYDIFRVQPDGQMWLSQRVSLRYTRYAIWREGEDPREAMSCYDCYVSHGLDHAIDIAVHDGWEQSEVWRVDDERGTPRRVASVNDNLFSVLDDDRYFGVAISYPSGYAPLELYDPEGNAQVVAPRVSRDSLWLHLMLDDPLGLLYESRPLDGPAALFRARLQPVD